MAQELVIIGIKVHNLKNIDVDIPLGEITVVTGLSGSGKSSLIYDTIYAESNRRFIESLGAFSRQYLTNLPAPDIDSARNIPPAIIIRYQPLSRSSRSTVGTSTEVYDYLRLLYSSVGTMWCAKCKLPVESTDASQGAEELIRNHLNKKAIVTFPVELEDRKIKDVLRELLRNGFIRLWEDKKIVEVTDALQKPGKLKKKNKIYPVADRVKVRKKDAARISEAIETSYYEGDGICRVVLPEGDETITFTENPICKKCGAAYPALSPALFSFNSPKGACPHCRGFGDIITYDIDRVIPDKSKSLGEGAVKLLEFNRFRYFRHRFFERIRMMGIPTDIPWEMLSEKDRELLWEGRRGFPGIVSLFDKLERKRYRVDVRAILARYRSYKVCPKCRGTRLRKEALQVKVEKKNIGKLVDMPLDRLYRFTTKLAEKYKNDRVATDILTQVNHRLKMLIKIGVSYLTLNRMTRTLSGGELQRINLINAAGARLINTLYLMDEPSIGLHPVDEDGLKDIIKDLKTMGNTVIIAEHSSSIIELADRVIELGPQAGELGGEVIFNGNLEDFRNGKADTLTSKYLAGELTIETPDFRREPTAESIQITGAREHNLKNIDLSIPLNLFTCITGPSGAGKSTLLLDVLYNHWRREHKKDFRAPSADYDQIDGLSKFKDVIPVKGGDISKSPRSCVVTFIGVFNEIRALFAGLLSARMAGLTPGNFSFNTADGRCPECKGRGEIIVDMQFLPEVKIICERCRGTRYKKAPLNHSYMGKNINDVLNLTVSEGIELFKSEDKITRKLKLLEDVNLGYLKLGQALDTLSSGEAARLTLARIIGRGEMTDRLFLFDEPSLGLHPHNINKLLKIFTRLLVNGATVICIDHNLDIIKSADYIIDMGPRGGVSGGRIVAQGTPEEIAENNKSVTGPFLKPLLEQNEKGREKE